MDLEKLQKKFPVGFPVEKLPPGAKEEAIEVYRICRTGKVEPASFYPTYLDYELSNTKEHDGTALEIDEYSLSTYEKARDARNKLKFFRGRQPMAVASKGLTEPVCGIVQRTKERVGGKSSHVDWWLYEGAEPHRYFKETELLHAEEVK